MIPETSKSNWSIDNIYRTTRELLEGQLDELLRDNRVEEALELVGREGRKLLRPTRFYLGKSQWTNGVMLGPRRLAIRTAKVMKVVVFDLSNNCFRFCESPKEIKTPQPGIELEAQADQGHKIFFEEAERNQQKLLLKETLGIIRKMREKEISGR